VAHIIKDSGIRHQFETGSVRDTEEGKGRYDLLPPEAIKRLAIHYQAGAKKYTPRNWEKGQSFSRVMSSMIRHAFQAQAGHKDEDHLAAVAWNAFALMTYEDRIRDGRLPASLNDLYPATPSGDVITTLLQGPDGRTIRVSGVSVQAQSGGQVPAERKSGMPDGLRAGIPTAPPASIPHRATSEVDGQAFGPALSDTPEEASQTFPEVSREDLYRIWATEAAVSGRHRELVQAVLWARQAKETARKAKVYEEKDQPSVLPTLRVGGGPDQSKAFKDIGKDRPPLVYVSGPFTDKSGAWAEEKNVRVAEEIGAELWKAGFGVIVPHANTRFYGGVTDWSTFLAGDLVMVERADVVVLTPKWARSKGATLEREHALANNIPVHHWAVGEGNLTFNLEQVRQAAQKSPHRSR
jgi:hypothetical protein